MVEFHAVKGSRERYGVGAVDRAVAVLAAFDGKVTMTLADVARGARLSETTALRYLATLERNGLVERDADSSQYRLGLRLFQLGQRALADRDPRRLALPFMDRLLERFDESVNLAIRQGDALVLVEALESTRSIKTGARVGEQDVWHASSLGKAVLATLPEHEVRGILARCDYHSYTKRTLTSFADVARELSHVRERGYAVDEGEFEEDLRCVGAAILDGRGRATYAISLSGPANRVVPRVITEMGREVSAAARAISARLGYVEGVEPRHSRGTSTSSEEVGR